MQWNRMARHGETRSGEARLGEAGAPRIGKVWNCGVRTGMARQERIGRAECGSNRCVTAGRGSLRHGVAGKAGEVGSGAVCRVKAGSGRTRRGRNGVMRMGKAGQGSAWSNSVWSDKAGVVRLGRSGRGTARTGVARCVPARQARCGLARHDQVELWSVTAGCARLDMASLVTARSGEAGATRSGWV